MARSSARVKNQMDWMMQFIVMRKLHVLKTTSYMAVSRGWERPCTMDTVEIRSLTMAEFLGGCSAMVATRVVIVRSPTLFGQCMKMQMANGINIHNWFIHVDDQSS